MGAVRTKLERNYCYKCWYYIESKTASARNHYKKMCRKTGTFVFPGLKACGDFLNWHEEYLRRKGQK